MTTYRPGTHWKITIVEEGDGPLDEHGHHVDSRLRAVVMDGKVLTTDAELAGRVCALLNAYMPSECTRVGLHNCDGEWRNHDHEQAAASGTLGLTDRTPDVSYARGAAEALAEVRRRLDMAAEPDEQLFAATIREMLRIAAAELGVEPTPDTGAKLEDITEIVGDGGPGIRTYRQVSASPPRPAPDPGLSAPPVTPDTHSAPASPRTISRGQKPCGCAWSLLETGVVRWHARCAEHAPMCRNLEQWELQILDYHGLTLAEPGEPERKADQP